MKKNTHSITSIILIILCVLAISYIGAEAYMAYKDTKQYDEAYDNMCKVSVEAVNDSTYTIYLGDSTSYFSMELAKDTLFIDSHQILLFSIVDDTIRALTHKKLEGEKYKDEFLYNFKYNDFFDGKMPLKDKIKINFN